MTTIMLKEAYAIIQSVFCFTYSIYIHRTALQSYRATIHSCCNRTRLRTSFFNNPISSFVLFERAFLYKLNVITISLLEIDDN